MFMSVFSPGYPLTRFYENTSLKRNNDLSFLRDFAPSQPPVKQDIFKELQIKFICFATMINATCISWVIVLCGKTLPARRASWALRAGPKTKTKTHPKLSSGPSRPQSGFLFGTSPIFLECISRFIEDFPDWSFSSSSAYLKHLQGTFPKVSATQSGPFGKKKVGTPPRLETPRFTFSRAKKIMDLESA